VEKLYLASIHSDELMKTEQQLQEFVLPLSSDDEIEKKFFSNPTIENVEKRKAIQTFAEQNKLSVIVTALLS
jgi:predicted metal-binding transcription factor (methanogenesis marker protein 9)